MDRQAGKLGDGIESFIGKDGLSVGNWLFKLLFQIRNTQGPAVSDMEPMESLLARVSILIFQAIPQTRDAGVARALTAFFRQHSIDPSMDERFDRHVLVASLMTKVGSDKLHAAAILVAMIRLKAHLPVLADKLDKVFMTTLADALPVDFGSAPLAKKKPSDVFLETITPEIQSLAQTVWEALRDPKLALVYAAGVAEDVNWTSNRVGSPDELPFAVSPSVQEVGTQLEWGVEGAAAFMAALLRLAGLKSQAVAVMRQALSEFADYYKPEPGKFSSLRQALQKLATEQPELRRHLIPLLRGAD